MAYREFLAVRRALAIYLMAMAVIGSFNAWGAGDSGGIYLSQVVAIATVSACIFALLVGTRLGTELRKGVHGAFVRPVSRARYAWTVFAVGIAAVAAAYILALAALAVPYQFARGFPSLDFRGISFLTAVILPIGSGIAWYGVAAAAGVASRGARTITVLLPAGSLALWCGAMVYAWHAATLFRVISLVNPLTYVLIAFEHVERSAHPQIVGSLNNGFYDALPVSADTAVLFAIGISALLAATLAWKRAQA